MSIITVGEYVQYKQPGVYSAIAATPWPRVKAPWGIPPELWEAIMKEPPLPGRAGLLPWERGL